MRLLFVLLLAGCGSSSSEAPATAANDAATASDTTSIVDSSAPIDSAPAMDASPGSYWYPRPGTSWQWQLSGTLDTSFDVTAYDIDLFETTEAQIAALHASKRKVICYFDTAYEPGRPDSAKLDPVRRAAMRSKSAAA